jgi:CRP-like cAMP-binding protein
LKKKPGDRIPRDLAIIQKCLEKTDLANKFLEDKIDENNLGRMLYFCSMYMGYHLLKSSHVLFRVGDKGDKFYIILKGKVNILKHASKTEKLTAVEYYNYLKDLRDKNEKYMIKLSLSANSEVYPFSYKDIEEIEDIVFKIKYRKTLLLEPNNVENIRKVFEDTSRDPKNYDLDLNELHLLRRESKKDSYSSHIQRQISIISEGSDFRKLEKYRYIENELDKRQVTLFYYYPFMEKVSGHYFGDFALDKNINRSGTIVAETDTHLGYFDVEVYNEYLALEKQRLTLKEISFLADNYFFTPIQKKIFEKRFFNHFIYEEHYRGERIINENEEIQFIYFIKEGEVELTINKSTLELHKLVKYLQNLNIIDDGGIKEYQLKNEPKNFTNELMKKRSTKMFIYGSKEIIGAEEFFYGINSLFDVKVFTDKVKMYKVEVKNVLKILHDENDCYGKLEFIAKSKMKTVIRRLIDVKNVSLSMIDKNFNNTLKLGEIVEMKENPKLLKIRSEFNPKLKELSIKLFKNDNKVSESEDQHNKLIMIKETDTNMSNNELTNNTNDDGLFSVGMRLGSIAREPILPKLKIKNNEFIYENKQISKIKKELNKFHLSSFTTTINSDLLITNRSYLPESYNYLITDMTAGNSNDVSKTDANKISLVDFEKMSKSVNVNCFYNSVNMNENDYFSQNMNTYSFKHSKMIKNDLLLKKNKHFNSPGESKGIKEIKNKFKLPQNLSLSTKNCVKSKCSDFLSARFKSEEEKRNKNVAYKKLLLAKDK